VDTVGEGDDLLLVPARIVNEHVYCPRLAYLEWVHGEFAHSSDTLDGALQHRRVDREEGRVPDPDAIPEDLRRARAVTMSAPKLGVIAKMDLLEMEGGVVVPVDTKRGKAPDVPHGAWDPERVQSALQAMVLEENGYSCPEAVIYYAGSKRRVGLPLDEELRALAMRAVLEVRENAAAGVLPPPLVDSPKCPRCSLVGICLPDETRAELQDAAPGEIRRMFPARDDAVPLYVQQQGSRVGKTADRLVVKAKDEKLAEVRLMETSHVALFGHVQISSEAVAELFKRDVPICWFSYGGWLHGMARGFSKNVALRQAQHGILADPARRLDIARRVVFAKIRNQRTLLRRNAPDADAAVDELKRLADVAVRTDSVESLLGVEGAAARTYFSRFGSLVKTMERWAFDFQHRNRRPPRDPVNALLSFAYALLVKDLALAVEVVGFDPMVGFYHQPHHGRPSLALDLAEEFRAIVADSVVIGVINNREIQDHDFVMRGGACALTASGRRALIAAYERRVDSFVTHPRFGYSLSYRRVMEVQARLLGRHLLGELPAYEPFRTR
jgi:CRISPR-associated protein Cas1